VFPDKTISEHQKIAKGYYKHLCDLFVELIKMMSISEKEILKRFHIKNPEVITQLEELNKSIIFLYAHYNTFEYSSAFTLYDFVSKGFGVYKKQKNTALNNLILKIRSRFGVEMIDKDILPKLMIKHKAKHQMSIYGMIADQSPKIKNIKYWVNFLGLETPVFIGAEMMAKRLDLSVSFMKIDKIKRGFYEVELVPITTSPKKVANYKITDTYFNLLEHQILKNPEFYFWSHKRWKYTEGVTY
jgi:KDO2-lipid IV(A) lauroyltransferase